MALGVGTDRSVPATDAGVGAAALPWRLAVETTLADSRAADCGLFGLVAATAEAVDTTVFLLGPDGTLMKPSGWGVQEVGAVAGFRRRSR